MKQGDKSLSIKLRLGEKGLLKAKMRISYYIKKLHDIEV